jgi:hypothetical protein
MLTASCRSVEEECTWHDWRGLRVRHVTVRKGGRFRVERAVSVLRFETSNGPAGSVGVSYPIEPKGPDQTPVTSLVPSDLVLYWLAPCVFFDR